MSALCCGYSLQTGTKIIAWIKILASAYLCWVSIRFLVHALSSEIYAEAYAAAGWTFLAIGIIYGGVSLLLLRGACKKDVRLLNVWITIDKILVIYAFFVIIKSFGFKVGVPGIIFAIYSLVIVTEFKKELKNGAVSQSKVY